MKKVLFIQIKGKSKAGVWFVNKTIGEYLVKKGYDVTILSIRDNPGDINIECDERIHLHTINKIDLWEIARKRDIKSFKSLKKYVVDHRKLRKDYQLAQDFINDLDPDYIIASHYQCLDCIPQKYYSKTVHEQHSCMRDVLAVPKNYKILKKYNHKIFGYVWLSKATQKIATEKGFNNNFCLYNPVRFDTDKIANVKKNKKLVCITRIENYQKRIDLMIKIVDTVLKKHQDWTFELYGSGKLDTNSLNCINNNHQIIYKGFTDNPEKVLLSSSINLNTSWFEGFSLSILEAAMCGIPTISFNFGESAHEEIINNKTGYIIENDNVDEYVSKLSSLMNNEKKLQLFSQQSKLLAKKYLVDNVITDWINLFKKIDKQNNAK